jgi:hypothetical protein
LAALRADASLLWFMISNTRLFGEAAMPTQLVMSESAEMYAS